MYFNFCFGDEIQINNKFLFSISEQGERVRKWASAALPLCCIDADLTFTGTSPGDLGALSPSQLQHITLKQAENKKNTALPVNSM